MRTILTLCVVLFFMLTSFAVYAAPDLPVLVKFAPASPLKINTFATEPSFVPYQQGTYCEFENANNNANTNINNFVLRKPVSESEKVTVKEVSTTISGYDTIHNASFLIDGKYGNGRSWIGEDTDNSPYAIIDLGGARTFRAISFGRDRLGRFVDRNPGVFSIDVSNDGTTWRNIVQSAQLFLPQAGTVLVTINGDNGGICYRYVKLTVTKYAAVDEIEIFEDVPKQ